MTTVSSFFLSPFAGDAIKKLFRVSTAATVHTRGQHGASAVEARYDEARQSAIAAIVSAAQGGEASGPQTAGSGAGQPDVRIVNVLDRYGTWQQPSGDKAIDIMNLNVDRALWINTAGGNDIVNINARRAEFLDLGAGDDRLNISAKLAAYIRGGSGNDIMNISASGYAGLISGDSGDDTINIAARYSSFVDGGEGNDIVNIAAQTVNFISGDGGNDIINIAARQIWGVSGGTGNDVINIASRIARAIDAGAGNDVINIAARDVSWVYGQSGDDIMNVTATNDVLGVDGSTGNDNINITAGTAYLTKGGSGDDTITLKTAVVDWVSGGKGNDRINLVDTRDASIEYANGDGKDLYSLSGEARDMRIRLQGGLRVEETFISTKYNKVLITFANSDDFILIDTKDVTNANRAPSVVTSDDGSYVFLSWKE